MKKRMLSLLLCALILFGTLNGFTVPLAAAGELPKETVVIDYNCDSLTDPQVTVSSNNPPYCYFADSKTDGVEQGTVYMSGDSTSTGYSTMHFPFETNEKSFSLEIDMKVDALLTPAANIAWRGLTVEVNIPGGRTVHVTFHSLGDADENGNNAAVTVMTTELGNNSAVTERIAIPDDDAFHAWNIQFDGDKELRIFIDGTRIAAVRNLTLPSQADTASVQIKNVPLEIKSGKNDVTFDHIRMTTGTVMDKSEVIRAMPQYDSSAEALTVMTELTQLKKDAEITVSVSQKNNSTVPAVKTYRPADITSAVTLTDVPFSGMCEIDVTVTGAASTYCFDWFLPKTTKKLSPGDTADSAVPDTVYLFDDFRTVNCPTGTMWKHRYYQWPNGDFGTFLYCNGQKNSVPIELPFTVNGKFAVYIGYGVGMQSAVINGHSVNISDNASMGGEIREQFVFADDFKNAAITVANDSTKAVRIAYVKLVALSDEKYEKYLAEDDAQNFIWDDDGYSCFCYRDTVTPESLAEQFITRFAENLNVGQYMWCTYYTSILNYDSPVWWKYVTERLTELDIPKEQWPENFLDHVDKKGNQLHFEHLMRDIDKTAEKNILKINEHGAPHQFLSDFAAENGYGDVYVSLKMSSFADGDGPWAFMNSTLYYLYPEFIRGGSYQFSFQHETYRNYMHDLLIELALCENVAGVMMNFSSYPYIFGAELIDTAERTKIMNEFVKSVREDMPEGKKLIASIMLPTEENTLPWGLDYHHWVKEKYIDRLIVLSNVKEKFLPFEEELALCKQYGCEFYLGINGILAGHDTTKEEEALQKQGVKLNLNNEQTSTLQWLLRAYEAYTAGADGLYAHNGFAVSSLDPVFTNLNNKTLMEKWYEYEYPASLVQYTVTNVSAKDLPDSFKNAGAVETTAADTTETDLPAHSEPTKTPLPVYIAAAAVIALAAVIILLKKKKK